MDDGKDWTWYAALAQGSVRTLYKAWARRGGTLYKAVVQYTILREPSARQPWVGRTDAEEEEEELGALTKRDRRV